MESEGGGLSYQLGQGWAARPGLRLWEKGFDSEPHSESTFREFCLVPHQMPWPSEVGQAALSTCYGNKPLAEYVEVPTGLNPNIGLGHSNPISWLHPGSDPHTAGLGVFVCMWGICMHVHISVYVCACVRTCVHVCCISTCLYTCVWCPEFPIGCLPPYFLRQDLSLNMELATWSDWLASELWEFSL